MCRSQKFKSERAKAPWAATPPEIVRGSMPAEPKTQTMKLVGELKDKVEKVENQAEAKEIIKEAGMELTDEEMDQVAGGKAVPIDKGFY